MKPSQKAKHGKRLTLIASACLALVGLAGAQPSSRSTVRLQAKEARTARQDTASSVPLERAVSLSAQLLEDTHWANQFQRAVLQARLGEAWLPVDADLGKRFLQDAVSAVAGDPSDLASKERKARLGAVRAILKIVMPLEQELSDRLLHIVEEESRTASARQETDAADRVQRLRDLGDAARAIVRDDPRRAANLAKFFLQMRGADMQMLSGSLQIRAADQMSVLFASLRLADREAADQLFLQGVASASQDYDYNVLFTLSELAFPTVADPARPPLPADLRSALLAVLVDGLSLAWQSDQNRLVGCRLGTIAARLLPVFSAPQRAAVEEAIRACADGAQTPGGQDAQDGIGDRHSSADYVEAAETEADARRRCEYKSKAAFIALQQERDAISALNIWDHFTSDERNSCPTWAADRELAAVKAIRALYLKRDLSSLQAVLDRTPESGRPKLQLNTAAMLFSSEDKALGSWMLLEARRSLEKTEGADPSVYLMLLTTDADISPGEIAQVLPLVVSGINRIAARITESHPDAFPAAHDLAPYHFSLSMLAVDPVFMESSIATIESAEQRASFRLGLLHAALTQYRGKQP